MLTGQTMILDTSNNDMFPIGFISTDDGRTLLVVAEHEDGSLQIMAAPVTLMQQNNLISPSYVKTMEGHLVMHPQGALLLVQTLDAVPTTLDDTEVSRDKEIQVEVPDCVTLQNTTHNILLSSNKKQNSILKTNSRSITVKKSINKRSPGRPRKNGTTLISASTGDLKCNICEQEFNKKFLYRKHMDHHAEEKPHRCPKCPASFNIPTNFTLHMATHNIGEPKCPECSKKFTRMASLKSHMLLHEKEENLFCTECEDAFSTKAQLDAHLKLHGEKCSTEDVRKCKLCNKQFVQPALYRLHIREHYRLQTKIVKQTKRGTKHKTMYKCTICLKSFQKPSQLMRHIRVHTGEKPFKCTVCSRAFTQKGSLQIHMWQHDGIRPHACSLCNAKFCQKGNLNAHILRVHSAPVGEPIYGCAYCSCIFRKLGSLNSHIKRMHSNAIEETTPKCDSSTEADMQATVDSVMSQLASLESSVSNPADSTESNSTSTLKKDILLQALKNSGLPNKNKTSKSGTSESKKVEAKTAYVTLLDRAPDGTMRKYLTIKQRSIGNIKWYSCFFCHKEFKKPSDLIRHLRVHTQEKPFKCSYCFRSFALKSTMIAHERTHTGAKKYSCSSCDKTFACHSSLTAHTRLHTKPHKCTVCDKSFSSSAFLKSHMKNHAKEKSKISPEAESLVPQIVLQEPLVISDAGNKISVARVQSKQKQVYDTADVARQHKCWVCHAAFRKISHLKQHYRRHTGERPFKCTKCDRRFTSNSVLKSHLHTHDDSRPYSCTVCNTKFSTQSSMKRHLVTHSNKRPFMCPYCHKTFKTSVNCRKHMKIHKHELAQRQLEQQKTQDDTYDTLSKNKQATLSVPENLTLSDDIEVSFQPQMAPDFTQAFSDQFQNITEEKDKSFLPTDTETHAIINTNLPEIDATNIGTSQTLHADETGTITLPNYTGDQTLTPESIREIEETLNQQLFNIGINLGIGGNLSRQIDDTNADTHESREQQPVLNIIYDNNKSLDSSANTIFTPQFDSFDMSQITLQTDTEIDMGLNATTSTNMSSILPSSVQEIQQLPPVSLTSDINDSQVKIAKQVMILNSKQSSSDLLRLNQTCPKYPKVIAKADTTNSSEIRIQNSNCDNPSKSTTVYNNNGNNKLRFTCDICNENFQDSSQLKTHSKLHTLSDIVCSDINESIDIAQCNSLLQCHICSETGFTTEGLKDHLVIHRGTKGFQCTECLLKFCTNGGLSRHLKMHTNKQQWKCSICQKVFGSKALLKSHSKIHDNWNVTSVEPDSSQREGMPSDIKLSAISTLDVGLSSDSSVSEKVLMDIVAEKKIIDRIDGIAGKKEMKEYTNKCKYCPKTFRKPSDLIRHVRTHTGERPYKCDYCGKSFAVKCTLDSHLKVHSGKKTLCCHVCNSMFATKGSLKVHMRLHTGSKPFRCPICDLRFRTSGHRKVHLLKHMREYKGSPKRKQRHMKVAAVTEAAASLEKIVESTTEQTAPDNVVPENIHYSNLEDTISIDTSGLASQITFNADGTVVSNNSMLSLNESNQLVANLHFLLANGLVTIQADDALLSQGATSNANIIQNQSRVTEFITPTTVQVPCIDADTNHVVIANQVPAETVPQTDQTTVQLNNCMTLMPLEQTTAAFNKIEGNLGKQNKSNPSKKECDICGKTFMKPYQVKRHKRIHTGERPYKCDLCTKSFAQRSTLQMHQKHHTGDRPHPCLHCKYSFTQKGNLQTHLKRVHQLDTLNVEKVRRGQQVLNARVTQDSLSETKTLSLDDISFVEFLK